MYFPVAGAKNNVSSPLSAKEAQRRWGRGSLRLTDCDTGLPRPGFGFRGLERFRGGLRGDGGGRGGLAVAAHPVGGSLRAGRGAGVGGGDAEATCTCGLRLLRASGGGRKSELPSIFMRTATRSSQVAAHPSTQAAEGSTDAASLAGSRRKEKPTARSPSDPSSAKEAAASAAGRRRAAQRRWTVRARTLKVP